MDSDIFKPKILIVDDIPENLFVLEKILNKLDAQVIRAASGNEALTQILDHDFALIILDVQMPDMDGYEVAEILKYNEKTENIPIIFVTAIDRDDAKEIKGYGTGAVDFIFKPLNKFILLSKVNIFLEMYKIRNSLEQIVAERTSELSRTNEYLKEQIEKNIKATREIERARAYLHKVINSISSSLISVDSQVRITDMNQHAQTLANMNSKEAVGRPISEVLPFYNSLTSNIEQAINSGEPVEKNRVPVYIRGKLVINNFSIYPFSFDESRGAVIKSDDVTERVKIDEIVIQSEKMQSMGGIAAGMAHEINNPLSSIIQNVQVIRNRTQGDLPANHRAAEELGITFDVIKQYMEKRDLFRMMEAIHQSGNKAAQIVDDMLSFSRKSEGFLKHENLEVLMEKSIKIAMADYKTKTGKELEHLEIIKTYQPDMPLISCQPGKIQQVMLNILKNAFQAMEQKKTDEKKTLTISIKSSDDNMASIEIADNGEGMVEETLKKIFNPFFTTRKSSSGLGLSISYFIITEEHKGTLTASSTHDNGAIFTIKIPLHKSIPAVVPA
ncbi:MAG: response regulator [Desulfamplus sp.]|nr:response regulator [Desulfamplus sp.]